MAERVAIVIVPRDRFSMFPRCVDALFRRTQVPFRVIVVSGQTDDATATYLRRLEATRDNVSVVLADRMLLPGEARNLGLREAGERFCVVLENDTLVHDNWLQPLLTCIREESAAVVTPLIWWYRGLHAAGGSFVEQQNTGSITLTHEISYTDLRRRSVDSPESHCILLDRQLLGEADLFDDVEPFDVDLGLTVRKLGLRVVLEPRSEVTYSAPPPLEVRDVPSFKQRWDWPSWEARNKLFIQKWAVTYDRSRKQASYRRQQVKLGLASLYAAALPVAMANLAFRVANMVHMLAARGWIGRFH